MPSKITSQILKSNSGQAMSEYLILVMLIAAASTLAATTVGKTIYGKLKTINTSLRGVTLESVRDEN
jgi:Flp pilus assembly pilin Flp